MAELFDQDSEFFSTVKRSTLIDKAGRRFDYIYDPAMEKLVSLQSQGEVYKPSDIVWKAAELTVKQAYAPLTVEAAHAQMDGQSFEVHPNYRKGIQRNSRVRKYLGVAHSSGQTMLFSSNQNKTFGFLCSEGWALDRDPETIDTKIAQFKSYGDNRAALVVVEGSLGYCMRYMRALQNPDFVVFCASEVVLQELGVQILDQSFGNNSPAAAMGLLDQYLFASKRAERKREGEEDAAIPSGSVPHPPSSQASTPEPERPTPRVEVEPTTNSEPPRSPAQAIPPPVTASRPRRAPQRSVAASSPAPPRMMPSGSGSGSGAKQVTPHAVAAAQSGVVPGGGFDPSSFGMGTAPGPDRSAGGGRAGDDFATRMASNAAAVLKGDADIPEPEPEGPIQVMAGMRVKEAMYGESGVVENVENGMATVQFADQSEPAIIPVDELRPEGA